MAILEQKISKLKKTISENKQKKAEIEGAISTYKKTLQEEYGLKSTEEAVLEIDKINADIQKIDGVIKEKWTALESSHNEI